MRIIITRHGETEENKAGILQGHSPGKLSAKGISQAKKVALRLKDHKINFIFSSDLARAANTAKEVAKYHPNIPIDFTEKLRERNVGEFQGKNKNDFGWNNEFFVEPKEGESISQVYKRAESFINEIFPKHHNDTVLLVCHGGIGKALVTAITGEKYPSNLQNTSISIFDINEDKNHEVICLNCIKHLEGAKV
jgi:broad specificity phosphatase PhoE